MKKKNPFSFHVDVDSFLPASDADKEYMVQMRPPSTFFKDGVKRLLKNKVATISFFIIIFLTLSCIILPMVWPYGYDQMLGMNPKTGKMDSSYNNLAPFEYSAAEGVKMFGTANVHDILIPKLLMDTTEHSASEYNEQVKAYAESLYNKYESGSKTEESFVALANDASANDMKLEYKKRDGAKNISFSKSKDAANWIWETKGLGKSVRTPGETILVDGDDGYHLIYFRGDEGETEDVFPHVFGTDAHGRDYLIRVVYGMRVSLAVGLFASIIVLILGMLIGAIAGYCGGVVDLVIMRIVDIIYALPDMLMVILLASVMKLLLGPAIEGTVLEKIGSNIISLFIVFGLLYWVSMSRLIRGQILSLREQEYVLSARASGAKSGWIIRKHLVPNCISVIIISTALQIPSAIFTESYLSFLGLGVNAPMPSLGSLASDALNGISSYPYRLVIPAVVISLIVLSLNLFGDGLRDAFDPKLNG